MIDHCLLKKVITNLLVNKENTDYQQTITKIQKESLPFRNTNFPFYPIPIFLNETNVIDCFKSIKKYVKILEKIIELYSENITIQEFFNFSPEIHQLVLTSIENEQRHFFSRLDGYISDSTQEIKILENNSDAPAGTIFTPRINAMSNRFIVQNVHLNKESFTLSENNFIDEYKMIECFHQAYYEKHHKVPKFMVVLQLRGKSNKESLEISKLRGSTTTKVVDPRDLVYKIDAVYTPDGIKINLVWNKINTVFWNELVKENPDLIQKWNHAISKYDDFMHFNPFSYRYITENKLFASLLYDEAFEKFLTEEELGVRNKLVPRSFKLISNKRVTYQQNEYNIFELAKLFKNQFVLKESYDVRGDGVIIGLDSDEETWKSKVQSIKEKGGILQEFISPKRLDFIDDIKTLELSEKNFHIDTFLFGQKILGFGAKASKNRKVNIFQGGFKVPILVIK